MIANNSFYQMKNIARGTSRFQFLESISQKLKKHELQARRESTAQLLENYTVLPLYLRARVEDWNVPSDILHVGTQIGCEQVGLSLTHHFFALRQALPTTTTS
jgi:hypothetical protein